jgi:glycosyltransferase involved in cell wall biosynthesis
LLEEAGPGRSLPRVVVVPLGINPAGTAAAPRAQPGRPYFVIIGTIEPKKNHLLLLNLWRQLRGKMGDETPRLIVIGRRGWENENIVDMLERSRAFAGFVEERGRLSDRDVITILGGARALLLPSFAEGYGLPLAEALSMGIPVICSDIPAFREVGGDVPEFLDPLDGPSWRKAIVDYATESSLGRQAQLDRVKYWVCPSWEDHFRQISGLIEETEILN